MEITSLSKGYQILNIEDVGGAGDGTTDNSTPLANALAQLPLGGTVYFPPGNYAYSQTIDLSLHQFVTFLGPAGGNVSGGGALANLIYTGAGAAGCNVQSSRGATFRGLGLLYSNPAFTGYLIDARQAAGHGNTTNLVLEDCTLSYSNVAYQGGPAALLILSDNTFAGAYSVDLNRVRFLGGNYNLIGRTGSSGFSNCVRISQCNFEFYTTAGILNPHLNWEVCGGTVFEPAFLGGSVGKAGGILCTAPASSLEVHSCWFGDELGTAPGAWIDFLGSGLSARNNNIGCQALTTGVRINGNCIGIAVTNNTFQGGGGASKGIDFGVTVGNSGFLEFGNKYSGVTTPVAGTIPDDAIYDAGGALTLNNPTIAGVLTAVNISLSAVAQLSVGTASSNLLTALQADFETSGYPTGWSTNANCTLATTTAAANHGARSLAVTSTTSAATAMSVISGFNGGTTPIFQKTAVTPGATYTALASFLCAVGSTPRLLQVNVLGFDSAGAFIAGAGGSNRIATSTSNFSGPRDNTSTWTQVPLPFTAAVPGSSTPVAYVDLNIAWFDSVNLTNGEVHYMDTAQIAPGLNNLWSLPGAATTYITSSSMQPSLNRDFSVAGNGTTSRLLINPIGGGAAGTFIGDGTQNVLTVLNGHLLVSGAAPAIAAGTGAGTSPTVTVTGTDAAGTISITTGSAPAGSATVATVTFAVAFAAAPKTVTLTPAGPNAAALSGTSAVYQDQASLTASAFVLKVGAGGLAATTTYTFSYEVRG